MGAITHAKVSTVPPDPTYDITTKDWNDQHVFVLTPQDVGADPAGTAARLSGAFMLVADGEEGLQGQPGAQGIQGPTGATGSTGLDGESGEDGFTIPGPQGLSGAAGAAGAPGLIGPPGMDGADAEPDFPIPFSSAPADPVIGSYSPGSFAVPANKYVVMSNRLQLISAQRVTLSGTARLRIT